MFNTCIYYLSENSYFFHAKRLSCHNHFCALSIAAPDTDAAVDIVFQTGVCRKYGILCINNHVLPTIPEIEAFLRHCPQSHKNNVAVVEMRLEICTRKYGNSTSDLYAYIRRSKVAAVEITIQARYEYCVVTFEAGSNLVIVLLTGRVRKLYDEVANRIRWVAAHVAHGGDRHRRRNNCFGSKRLAEVPDR